MIRDISIAAGELPEPAAGTEPERIYHYTDAGGLLGIVKNKCLWASDVWFMNDAREALYGVDVIERALNLLTPMQGAESEVHRRAMDFTANAREQEDALRSYIACLTKRATSSASGALMVVPGGSR